MVVQKNVHLRKKLTYVYGYVIRDSCNKMDKVKLYVFIYFQNICTYCIFCINEHKNTQLHNFFLFIS